MSSKIRDVDRGYRDLVRRAQLEGEILVGIFAADGAQAYPTDGERPVTVLDVALWNEFGTSTIPERSFIRAWFDENVEQCREAVRRMAEAVLAGKYTSRQAKELLAQSFVGQIQKRIAQGIPPPNAPETIARKGSDKPLIHTGQLRSSITYSVDGKQGTSEATQKRVEAEKNAKRAERKRVQAEKRALKKEGMRIRREIKKSVKGAVKGAAKDASKSAARIGKEIRKATKDAKRAATKQAKNVRKVTTKTAKSAYRYARRAVKKTLRKATKGKRRR